MLLVYSRFFSRNWFVQKSWSSVNSFQIKNKKDFKVVNPKNEKKNAQQACGWDILHFYLFRVANGL